jgi:hypothetical protein
LEVRAIDYVPYQGKSGDTLHQGYQLNVGNEPRDMQKMLLAQFMPSDVLPSDLNGTFTVTLEDVDANTLATAQAYVFPVPVDEALQKTVPFGTFSLTFTGGAGIRGK